MLERCQVVGQYKALAARAGLLSETQLGWLNHLPPYLCHLLIQEKPAKARLASLEHAFTGLTTHRGERFGDILLSYDGVEEGLYTRLPLDGHLPAKAPGLYRWIKLALEELAIKDSARYAFIQSWCSMIVWLMEDSDDPPETELTSVALPALPHCTFLTYKAIQHIPPKVIIPAITLYGLQENLFHESLHQQLSATLIFEDILTGSADMAPPVPIPWRATVWPVDRALHAAWVYGNVLGLRQAEIERGPEGGERVRQTLSRAYDEGRAALAHLVAALDKHRDSFTVRGQAILETVRGLLSEMPTAMG
jgi:hypothetical protein